MSNKADSLTQYIYKQFISAIRNGELKEGTMLTESEQASKFDVSKTPVREALNLLETDGLLVRLPHKGYMIKVISKREIMEVNEMRIILECAAVELAIKNATDSDIENINKQIVSFTSFDLDRYYETNYGFHVEIAKASNNTLLEDAIGKNLTKAMFAYAEDMKTIDIAKAVQSHIEIYNSIKARNVELACELTREHVLETQRRMFHN